MRQLAQAYLSAGQSDNALTLLEETKKNQQEKLGANHTETINSIILMALTYASVQRDQESQLAYQEAYRLARETLGDLSERTITLCNALAKSHLPLGNFEQAIQLYQDNYLRCQKAVGDQHDATLRTWFGYRSALLVAGEYEKAVQVVKAHLAATRKTASWRFVAGDHTAIAEAWLALGKLDEAIQEAEQALDIVKKVADGNESIWWPQSILGSAYRQQKKWQLADQHLQLAVPNISEDRKTFDAIDWLVAQRVYHDLAYVHRNWEDSTENEKWQTELAKFEKDRARFDSLAPAANERAPAK